MLTAGEIVDWAVSSWTAEVKTGIYRTITVALATPNGGNLSAILAATTSAYAVRAMMPVKTFLVNSEQPPHVRHNMGNNDFATAGFLALTAASFLLLCSSLLAIAFT